MTENEKMVKFYAKRIKSNIEQERFMLKRLGAELIRCPGIDSNIRNRIAEDWVMACNRCEMIEDDIAKLANKLYLGDLSVEEEEEEEDE